LGEGGIIPKLNGYADKFLIYVCGKPRWITRSNRFQKIESP
jgi:hypothetical protein